jgi:hypothetical protein
MEEVLRELTELELDAVAGGEPNRRLDIDVIHWLTRRDGTKPILA